VADETTQTESQTVSGPPEWIFYLSEFKKRYTPIIESEPSEWILEDISTLRADIATYIDGNPGDPDDEEQLDALESMRGMVEALDVMAAMVESRADELPGDAPDVVDDEQAAADRLLVDDMLARTAAFERVYNDDEVSLPGEVEGMNQLKREIVTLYETSSAEHHSAFETMLRKLDDFIERAGEIDVGRQEWAQQQIDMMRQELYAQVEVWQYFDEENLYSPDAMVGRHGDWKIAFVEKWRPFAEGGIIPSAIVWTRVQLEGALIRDWVSGALQSKLDEKGLKINSGLVGAIASAFSGSTNMYTYNSEMSFDEFQTAITEARVELNAALDARMNEGVDHLMHWETVFDEYFRYINETQFVNQWFYGRIFFPLLARVGKLVASGLPKIFPKFNQRLSAMKALEREQRYLINMIQAQHPEAAYGYAMDSLVLNSYTASGVARTGVALPHYGSVPPENYQAIKGVLTGRGITIPYKSTPLKIVGETGLTATGGANFLDDIWPFLRDLGPDDIATAWQQKNIITKIHRALLTNQPINGVPQGLLAGAQYGTQITLEEMAKYLPTAEQGLLEIGAAPINRFSSAVSLKDFTKTLGIGAVAAFGLTLPSLLISNETFAANIPAMGQDDSSLDDLDIVEYAFNGYMELRVQERADEIFENVYGDIYEIRTAEIEQKMKKSLYNSMEEIEAEMQAMVDERSTELEAEVQRVSEDIVANMTEADWEPIVSAPEMDRAEFDGQAWIERAASLVTTMARMPSAGASQAAFDELVSMSGGAPTETFEGANLNAIIEEYIRVAGEYMRELAEVAGADEQHEPSTVQQVSG